jgi:hypothetical protein
MITLKESILSKSKRSIKDEMPDIQKACIKEFIMSHYRGMNTSLSNMFSRGDIIISETADEDGIYTVDAPKSTLELQDYDGEYVTDGTFRWGTVDHFTINKCPNLKSFLYGPVTCNMFRCLRCPNIVNLEHSPKFCHQFCCLYGGLKSLKGSENMKGTHITSGEFVWDFDVSYNDQLTNLKRGPFRVKCFSCTGCKNLKSIKGGPQHCEIFHCCDTGIRNLKGFDSDAQSLDCSYNKNLTSLAGAPTKLVGTFSCTRCPKLMSLEDCPISCFRFNCENCGGKFTKRDVEKSCMTEYISV